MLHRKILTFVMLSVLASCGTPGNSPESSSAQPTSSSVASSTPSSASSSSTPQQAGFCPDDEPCKILPLGDSITEGMVSINGQYQFNGAYRVRLFELAVQNNKDITFVGSVSNGPDTVAGQPFPKDNEGHSGWTIQQISDIVPSHALDQNPHIILLHIGTNDMSQNSNGAIDRLESLIEKIVADQPGSLLAVSSIIPFPTASGEVSGFNAEIPGLIERKASELDANIIFVDQFQGFPTSELGDGVHPNPAGYARMGEKWYNAIEEHL